MTSPANSNERLAGETDIVRHLVATIAYRASNIVSDMPAEIAEFRPHPSVRSPLEILAHVNEVLAFLQRTLSQDGDDVPRNANWQEQLAIFHSTLNAVDRLLIEASASTDVLRRSVQGPLADVLVHLGQIGIFRRIAGSPVAGENYYAADVTPRKLN